MQFCGRNHCIKLIQCLATHTQFLGRLAANEKSLCICRNPLLAMPAKKKRRSSFVDDEAAHSGEDSDVGAPLRNLQMNDPLAEGQI